MCADSNKVQGSRETGKSKQKVFIEPEYVIVNLLEADKRNYLTVSRLFQFVDYLRKQLIGNGTLLVLNDVIFDISFDSIERTVRHNDKVFELIGNTIVAKSEKLSDLSKDAPDFLPKIARKFAKEFAA
jgi:hypothetical protein